MFEGIEIIIILRSEHQFLTIIIIIDNQYGGN